MPVLYLTRGNPRPTRALYLVAPGRGVLQPRAAPRMRPRGLAGSMRPWGGTVPPRARGCRRISVSVQTGEIYTRLWRSSVFEVFRIKRPCCVSVLGFVVPPQRGLRSRCRGVTDGVVLVNMYACREGVLRARGTKRNCSGIMRHCKSRLKQTDC